MTSTTANLQIRISHAMIRRVLPLIFSAPFFANVSIAQEAKPTKIFESQEVIEARVEGPWRSFMRDKDSNAARDGVFRYEASDGNEVNIPISITPRGLTRRGVCDFPPLRFDFDKEAARGTAFRGAGNLKLVTHCFRGSKYEQYTIKEYLAYRIYNLITDHSYRVQGLDLSYAVDADDQKPTQRFAFLIEDPDDVAKRHDLEKLSINDIKPSRLDGLAATRFTLFQLLISNLDWSALGGPTDRCCHNARLIGTGPDADDLIAIPYDLDSSGLVNAHYAAPPEGIPVRSVRQRLYRGFCRFNDSVPVVLDEFKAHQPAIMALFENEPRLDDKQRKYSLKYIGEFFEDMDDPKWVEKNIIGKCRG